MTQDTSQIRQVKLKPCEARQVWVSYAISNKVKVIDINARVVYFDNNLQKVPHFLRSL